MPRYFFDVSENSSLTIDDEGSLLPNVQAVRKEVMRTLPELAAQLHPDRPNIRISVRVRDDDGLGIFEASLTVNSRWLLS